MIFSKDKWNNGGEIRAFVPVSAALSFEKMEAPLSNAQDMFLLQVLGQTMIAKLQGIYDATEGISENDKRFLRLSQLAVSNLAFYYDFDALNLRIGDQGFQRQESDTWHNTYKYQEDHLRDSFRNKGFNAIDDLLAFLEVNTDTYPDFKTAPGYTLRAQSIVKSTEEVNRICFINNSRIIFMRMQSLFAIIEENDLKPILGENLYKKLRGWLTDPSTFSSETTTLDEFRLQCAHYVIMRAASRLIESTGSVTERGLYFTTVAAGDGNTIQQPATDDQLAWRIQVFKNDAENFKTSLIRFISIYLPDDVSGNSQHALDRDNDNHSTFFA